jgi:glutamyl-tRNA synthetase
MEEAFRSFLDSIGPHSKLRLAPTPSGFLHAGNVFNFLLNYTAARSRGATLLLRIDDLDADRKRPAYVQDVFDTLHWLGIDWDEGPADALSFETQWSQHQRLPLYQAALETLRAQGMLFACRKSRRDLAPFGGAYPEAFRDQNLDLDAPDVAWRIKTPPGFPMPDFIVRRRDGIPAYQVASVVDDVHFGVTHAVRGADLEASTQAQYFLADCLNSPVFASIRFYHHPLLLDDRGEKLSKSAGSEAVNALRSAGSGPEQVLKQAALWLDVKNPAGIRTARDLSDLLFDPGRRV